MNEQPVIQTADAAADLAPAENPSNAGQLPVGAAPQPIFTQAEIEAMTYRRYNPFAKLTAASLANALDAYEAGDPRAAAILWAAIIRRDPTVATIKAKREEAVALRDWTIIPVDDSSAAKDQAAALTAFYKTVLATSALNPHAAGGVSLLATQMMDAVPYGYAVHHLIYQADAANTFKLPGGRVVPTLKLRAEQVPLEFFEFRTGALRFLSINEAYVGQPLAPGAWLITTGPCLMMATAFRHYAKRLADQDLINFSEKFGTPGILVHTTEQQGTVGGAAAETGARQLGSNYRGVVYGATENKVEFLWPTGGGASNLPMTEIIEKAERVLTSLWLGADLSTMSRGGSGKGLGASLQADEQEKRERADCARLSETLNAQIDPTVIRWYFGDSAPVLARFVLQSPINEDRALLGDLVAQLVGLGAQVPVVEIARRLQVPLADKGDDVLHPPAVPTNPTPDSGIAINAAPMGAPTSRKLQNAAAARYAKAKLAAIEPFTGRLAEIELITDPTLRDTALRKFSADMATLFGQASENPANAPALADAMTAFLFNGVAEKAVETHGSAAA